ncbi:hypothetical protein [Streptomyces nitrosporeus]|uniref:hypothetical protein n=1 Tax=Streptomyces nitrosporeus TaxID=28894 RepID=UPI0019BD3DC9|nr:hypothetical protein [Streptomyces nitrosporeus]GGZ17845.1 hypothetical protein GCM10010327_56200 [Streptomyces nitrosporeus]
MDDVILVTSELVTNAHRYGTEPGDMICAKHRHHPPLGIRYPFRHPRSETRHWFGAEGTFDCVFLHRSGMVPD